MNIAQCTEDNQRTKDWFVERLGTFSGSEVADLMVKGRAKDDVFGQTAKDYIYEKMSERELNSSTIGLDSMWDKYRELTGVFNNKAMQFGTDNEADAIQAFADTLKDKIVTRTGSIPHGTIPNFTASPDAVISDKEGEIEGIVEVKVPLPKTFVKYRSEVKDAASLKAVNPRYYYQMMAEMMVSGATYGYFVCYNPFLINEMFSVRVERNEEDCKAIEERLALAEEFINKLKGKKDENTDIE